MLDNYCQTLSDEAQLKIALTFGKLILPVWEEYFIKNPAALDQLNALIGDTNRVKGGLEKIDIEFPKRAIEKIERSFADAKGKSIDRPIPIMKSDAALSPLLATCMQPLTNKEWDNTLTPSVRLVFTMIFNILAWILYRRKTDHNETHIYVAINMGADVLLRETIRSERNINVILNEYEQHKRQDTEDLDWENALRVGRGEPFSEEDVYRRIMGEKVSKDQGGSSVAREALRQMREEGKSYWNMMDEYTTGTSTTYSYDKEKLSYTRHEVDVIVGSFSNTYLMTENEMLDFLSQQALSDLRDSGFEV
jgi:hypothetical protein